MFLPMGWWECGGKLISPVWAIDERIAALGSVRGVKVRNCILGGSSLLCTFVGLSAPVSPVLPLLLLSQASKISIWTINCSARANNSVMVFGSEKARDLLSGA